MTDIQYFYFGSIMLLSYVLCFVFDTVVTAVSRYCVMTVIQLFYDWYTVVLWLWNSCIMTMSYYVVLCSTVLWKPYLCIFKHVFLWVELLTVRWEIQVLWQYCWVPPSSWVSWLWSIYEWSSATELSMITYSHKYTQHIQHVFTRNVYRNTNR